MLTAPDATKLRAGRLARGRGRCTYYVPILTKVSFDLASRPEGEGEPTAAAASLFGVLGGRSCDYQGTVLPDPPSIFAE